jgi:hypothetical protein
MLKGIGEPLIFVVILLLITMLIWNPSSPVRAEVPKDICKDTASRCTCKNLEKNGKVVETVCCTYTVDNEGVCKSCEVDAMKNYVNCVTIRKSPTTGGANVPQGGGENEQPPTAPTGPNSRTGGPLQGGGVLQTVPP